MINKINSIAKVCHQANKAFCEAQGDFTLVDWERCSEGLKMSLFEAVSKRIDIGDIDQPASTLQTELFNSIVDTLK